MATPAMVVRIAASAAELQRTFSSLAPVLATTKSQLETASKAFDGSKIISQAGAALESLNRLSNGAGALAGVTKLTEAEQAKLNKTLGEAIAKYKALGSSAPADMEAIYQATVKIPPKLNETSQATGKIWNTLKSGAGLIGVTFSAGAVVSFAKSVFDSASAIHDQSVALGFSAEAFQRNAFAARQSGGTVEDFVKAANKLNDQLGGGSSSTVASLAAAGLKFAEIRDMKPEQAWERVTDAVGAIQDPMLRANVAQDLLGKGALTLVPGMVEGFKKIGEGATVMKNETVDALEAAQDTWEKFWNDITIKSANALNFTLEAGKRQRQAAAMSLILMSDAEKEAWAKQTAVTEAMANGTKYADEYAKALARLHPVHEDIRLVTEKSRGAVDGLTAAEIAAQKAIQSLADTYTGKALASEVAKLAAAEALAEKQGGLTAYQYQQLGKQLVALANEGAVLPRSLDNIRLAQARLDFQTKVDTDVTKAWAAVLRELPKATLPNITTVTELTASLNKLVGTTQQGIDKLRQLGPSAGMQAPPVSGLATQLGAASGAIEAIGQVTSGTMHGVVSAVSQGIDIWRQFASTGNAAAASASLAGMAMTLTFSSMASVVAGAIEDSRRMRQAIADTQQAITDLGGTPINPKPDKSQGSLVYYSSLAGGGYLRQLQDQQRELEKQQQILNDTMGRYGLSLDDVGTASERLTRSGKKLADDFALLASKGFSVQQVTKGAASQLNALIGAALEGKQQLPASLAPYIADLIKSGQLTEELKNKILGIADPTPWQDMEEAAKRYGINVDDLGNKFQQAKLNDTVAQLAKDWKLLAENGANMDAVLAGMGDSIQGVITNALKFGITIPDSLKDVVQKFIDSGKAVDDNGNALKDVSQIKFADPIISDTDRLIAKLDELIEKITGPNGLAAAFNGLTYPDTSAGAGSAPAKAHAGAMVLANGIRRYHAGAARVIPFPQMSADEFPAILQTGEAVLNRQAVQTMGEPAIAAMNRGQAGGRGVVVHHSPNITINAVQGMSTNELASKFDDALTRNTNGLLTKVKRAVNG